MGARLIQLVHLSETKRVRLDETDARDDDGKKCTYKQQAASFNVNIPSAHDQATSVTLCERGAWMDGGTVTVVIPVPEALPSKRWDLLAVIEESL